VVGNSLGVFLLKLYHLCSRKKDILCCSIFDFDFDLRRNPTSKGFNFTKEIS
jgi:hypothetical protein